MGPPNRKKSGGRRTPKHGTLDRPIPFVSTFWSAVREIRGPHWEGQGSGTIIEMVFGLNLVQRQLHYQPPFKRRTS